MKKEFVEVFAGLADESERIEAKRIAKVLEKNGIDSVTRLINMSDDAIYNLKGIGDRSMHIISKIKTREKCKAEKKMNEYKKKKGKLIPKDFKYYAARVGIPYLRACQFEHCLKRSGIRDMNDFINSSQEQLSQIHGIGPKCLQWSIEIKAMASK